MKKIAIITLTILLTVLLFVSCNSDESVDYLFSAVQKISLNKTEISIEAGKTETLVATVEPEKAKDKTVTWSSSNTDVATVDEKGVVTGVAAGEATITAKAGNKTATCKVSVNVIHVTGVTLDETSTTVYVGKTKTLVATVSPEDATDKSVTWASSNTDVATVDQSGKITAIAEGEAVITVTTKDKGLKATCDVSVKVAFTITFNANDGTETKSTQVVDKGVKTQLDANTFMWDDYGFMYWNTKADGTGDTYKEKSDVTLYEDINLFAQRGHLITSSTTTLEGGKTYTINEEQVTNGNRILIDGNTSTVTIYLPADKTLKLSRGLSVIKYSNTESQTLIIDGDDSGQMRTGGSGIYGYAGIGGENTSTSTIHAGNVIIHGGIIEAEGTAYAAGIGGGYNSSGGNGGTVNITGGTVTAIGGQNGSGIGGGAGHYSAGGNGGTVTISGGTVIAKGGSQNSYGDGIGAGGGSPRGSSIGTLTILNGLTVYGDSFDPPTEIRDDYDTTRYRYMIVKKTPQ